MMLQFPDDNDSPELSTVILRFIVFLLMMAFVFCVLMGCAAHTDFYGPNGKKTAHFEGDMTGVVYRQSANGAVYLSGNINHSAATTAQGKAMSDRVGAVAGLAGVVAGYMVK